MVGGYMAVVGRGILSDEVGEESVRVEDVADRLALTMLLL